MNRLLKSFFGLTLGVAFSLGVAASLNANKKVEIKEADAATLPAGTKLYFRFYDGFFSDSATAWANYQDGSNNWHSEKLTSTIDTQANETLYVLSLGNAAKNMQILRKNSTASEQWGYTSSADCGNVNLYEVTGYGQNTDWMSGGFCGASIREFYFKTPNNGSVTLTAFDSSSTNKGSITTNTLTYVYSDWHVTYNANADDGYFFSTWTYSSSKDGTYSAWESSGTTNPTTVYTNSNTYHSAEFYTRTIGIFNSESAVTGGTIYSMSINSATETVTTTAVNIEKDQYIRRSYNNNYGYGTYFAGGTDNASTAFNQIGEDTVVHCKVTGVYTIYNKEGDYHNWKDIWVTRDEAASAKLIAKKFNAIITPICSNISSVSQLQAVWGSVSGTELFKHFNNQYEETMAYFKTDSSTSDPDIMACVARYDYIVRKYGTTALPDFLDRDNGYTENGQQSHILISLFGQSGNFNNGILVAVAISALGILSVGAYFFFKKSKKAEE